MKLSGIQPGGHVSRHLAVPGILTVALLCVGAPSHLAAQQRSAVSGADLEAAVLARAARRNESQAVVQRFLRSDGVRRVADGMGITVNDLNDRVATLDEATLNDLADRTRAAERELAGGDTIVISSTVVIIALLIIILILVAD